MRKVRLQDRTAHHVRVFWERTLDEEIARLFPFSRTTLENALLLFEQTLHSDAASFGKVILYEDRYVGDVWCYSIDESSEKSAFLSVVLFDKSCWGHGVGTEALKQFCALVFKKYQINKICAFAYKANKRSDRLLKRIGFRVLEEFEEDGIPSRYYELPKLSEQTPS